MALHNIYIFLVILSVLCNYIKSNRNSVAYQTTIQSKTPIWNQDDLKIPQGVFKEYCVVANSYCRCIRMHENMRQMIKADNITAQ